MTDQDLQNLYNKRDEIVKKRNEASKQYDEVINTCVNQEEKITALITQEELDRTMTKGKDLWIEKIKQFFRVYRVGCKVTDELWMVEVDGKKLCSSKGKYTWTSENRAFRGVCDYIYYHDYDISHLVNQNKLDLGALVEELIDEGYIKIIRIV